MLWRVGYNLHLSCCMVSCPLYVGRWYVNEFIRHLTGLILSPGGWHATLFSPANFGGGAILDADYPTIKQVDMGYNVTCTRITPDLTFIIIP